MRRSRDRQGLLARGPRSRALEARGASAPARARRVRAARAQKLRRRRDRVHLPARAHARRRLRADPASATGGEALPHCRVDRVARPLGGSRRDARAPLRSGPRVRASDGRRNADRSTTEPASPSARPASAPSPSTRSRRQRSSTSGRSSSGRTLLPELLLRYGRVLAIAGDERGAAALGSAAEGAPRRWRSGGRRRGACVPRPRRCICRVEASAAYRPHGERAGARARRSSVRSRRCAC